MKKKLLILAALSFAIAQGSYAMNRQKPQGERPGSPEEALLAIAEGALWLGEIIAHPVLACTRTKREKLEKIKKLVKKDHKENLKSHISDNLDDSPVPGDLVTGNLDLWDEKDREDGICK